MRKYLGIFILLLILVLTFTFKNQIISLVIDNIIISKEVNLEYKNEYYLSYNFNFVHNVDEFELNNKEDLLNLYYTVLNSGVNSFEFYCPSTYKNCINDVIDYANNQKELSYINGFVHPFNSFDTIQTTYDSLGKVTLRIVKTYTDLDVVKIKDKIKEIVDTLDVKDKSDKDKIKIIHDYIINNTKYDKDRTDKNIIKYDSNTAYGVFFEGYGICSGYSDAMAIFLDYFGIPNFKVTSENHVWNAVYIDNEWYHLDLTWDDPILDNGKDVLFHNYFLIDTSKLESYNDNQHNFDKKIYSELFNK